MKKLIFAILLLFISVSDVGEGNANTLQLKQETVNSEESEELSIKQAIELAFPAALKWSKNAQLVQAINIDLDKPGKLIGNNGKRKYWNIIFGVPNTNKNFLVTIHNGNINQTNDLTSEGTSPIHEKEFIQMKEIQYDSPELLKKSLKIGNIYPGKDWAKGYNFRLIKDTERNIPLLLVIGWNSDQSEMTAVGFNASTGEYIEPNS